MQPSLEENWKVIEFLYSHDLDDYWNNLKPPRPIGEKTSWAIKLGGGLVGFVFICGIIFFPLLFFSSINPIQSEQNSIEMATTEVSLQGFGQLCKSFHHSHIQLKTDTSKINLQIIFFKRNWIQNTNSQV
jgi:hypothetical protein